MVRLSLVFTYSPLRPHKEAALSPDQTLLSLAQIWVFVSGHKGLAPGLSCVKGWLSPKLCDLCDTDPVAGIVTRDIQADLCNDETQVTWPNDFAAKKSAKCQCLKCKI